MENFIFVHYQGSIFNTVKSIFLGEVIGFVKDPKNENKQVICKLDYKLASESILKGVVTRSQYLEARLPEKGGKWGSKHSQRIVFEKNKKFPSHYLAFL